MGIGLSNANWLTVISKNKEEDKKRVERGARPHFPDPEYFTTSGNIKTSEKAEKFIEAHRTKYDENGKALPSTARGKRRRERRQQ